MLVCGTIGVGSLGVLALAGLFLRRSTGMRIPSSGFSLGGGGGVLKQLQIHAHARRVAGGQRYILHPEDSVPLMTATPTDPSLYLEDNGSKPQLPSTEDFFNSTDPTRHRTR